MADLKRLGSDLKRIDRMMVDLTHRRMEIARLVGFEKKRTGKQMFRSEIEDQRLDEIATYAQSIGVNPNMARSILYALINESCKQQTILLQSEDESDLEILSGAERRDKLRANLLRLTEIVAPIYDETFYGSDFFSRTFTSYERSRLTSFVAGLNNRELAVDLGCGAGHASVLLSDHFHSVVGIDISQHMQYHATLLSERHGLSNTEFLCHDLETGLPFENESVSMVNMNYGAASDVFDFATLLDEIYRVLIPSGGAFLSFYNSDAISQKFGFLPWKTEKASSHNPYTSCLDVSVTGEQISVHARPYTAGEALDLLNDRFDVRALWSYPFLASLLPPEALEALQDEANLTELEQEISRKSSGFGGAYLICEVTKKAD